MSIMFELKWIPKDTKNGYDKEGEKISEEEDIEVEIEDARNGEELEEAMGELVAYEVNEDQMNTINSRIKEINNTHHNKTTKGAKGDDNSSSHNTILQHGEDNTYKSNTIINKNVISSDSTLGDKHLHDKAIQDDTSIATPFQVINNDQI